MGASRPASGSEARPRPDAGAGAQGDGFAMSAVPQARSGPAQSIAGLLAALSIFFSLIGLAYRPGRLIPVAILIALIATGIGGRNARLAAFAIGVGGVCFVVGMAVAVLTDHPIF